MVVSEWATDLARLIVIITAGVAAVPLVRRSADRRSTCLAIVFGIVLALVPGALRLFHAVGHWNPPPPLAVLSRLDALGFAFILFGVLLGGFEIRYPALSVWFAPSLGPLFPFLFITVACGACSGFHSIVASGTSSKQLNKESDARTIGYGAMLIEGLVAVIALATVITLQRDDQLVGKAPLVIYATGMSKFLSVFHIPAKLGFSFGLLALSTFILTTLDTATRLGRYVFEEFFGLQGARARYLSTIATLVLPTIFVLITLRDPQGNPIPAWKAIWPVFGATNQLLAGLVLLVVAVWLKRTGKKAGFVLAPMVFMTLMTIWALALLVKQYGVSAIGAIAAILLGLSAILIVQAAITLRRIGCT
jgi:carbon starvation protein